MNQEQNNLNPNNFNTQGNNGMPNNQPLNNQNFNNTFNQNIHQRENVNQQSINHQPQPTPSFQQPINQMNIEQPIPQPMNSFDTGSANNQSFNSKPPKKMNLGLIIGIVVAVAVIGIGIVLGSKLLSNSGNSENKSGIKNNINNSNENKNETENNINNSSNDKEQDDSKLYETWGRTDIVPTNNGTNVDRFNINVPKYTGNYYRRAKIAEHLDNTVVLISGQYSGGPFVEQVPDILSSYLTDIKKSLESYYGILSSNFNITIDSSKPITIGDYDMYTHTGIITFDYDTTKRTYQYVAYATHLKGTKNCAYWMVYDISEDQSKGKLIQEHALNMAKTFREEEE